MIAENLQKLRKHIAEICQRCHRNPNDIQLVAVSKTFSPQRIREALAVGIYDFGENYVQELQEKRKEIHDAQIRWHFIGHLQSNKVKYIIEYIDLIHSVDTLDLIEEIDKRSERLGRVQDVLVEVHTTDEASKFGIAPENIKEFAYQISQFRNVRLDGLMTMGPFSDDAKKTRSSFHILSELKKDIGKEGIENISMKHLSMGMTQDYEIAIEEGATILRIGTALFGERQPRQS